MPHHITIMTLCLVLYTALQADDAQVTVQDDTVKAYECATIPDIDGVADEACWEQAKWQTIDFEWITWGQNMDPADFSGRYKVAWSSVTDRIYFLVEVTDDVLVKGYQYPANGWWEWDGIEIFFDEDASGGVHQYNQNAFAYHLTAGNVNTDFQVMDVTANGTLKNYSDHFEVSIKNNANVYVWEISMIVYNESYNPNVSNNPREQLEAGRVSGLSMAYNDNDNPDENPKTRDNFIGSVEVPLANYNDHWINADWFGKVKLEAAANPVGVMSQQNVISNFKLGQNYPNPFNPVTTIEYTIAKNGPVDLTVYNIQGSKIAQLVDTFQNAGTYRIKFDGAAQASGIYFVKLKSGSSLTINKMILAK